MNPFKMTMPHGRVRRRGQQADSVENDQPDTLPASQQQYVLASTVETGRYGVDHPAEEGVNPMHAAYEGVYAQWDQWHTYHPGFYELPQFAWDNGNYLVPAAGSENLRAPRQSTPAPTGFSRFGTNRFLKSEGPVGGPTQVWTGNRTDIPQTIVGQAGPVGRSTYADGLARAYAQANRMTLNYALAESALVASV